MQPEHEYPDRDPETSSWPPVRQPEPPARDGLYWAMVCVAAATLILVIVNFGLNLSVRSIQGEVNQRQQFINQSAQLGRVYETLVRALAQVVVKEDNDRLRDLLTQNGITINATPPTASGSAAGGASAPASTTSPSGSPSSPAATGTGSPAEAHPVPSSPSSPGPKSGK